MGFLHALSETGQKDGRSGVGELVAQPFREDHSSAPARPRRRRREWVGPRVAERLRSCKHPVAEFVGDEFGVAKRLRGTPHRDTGPGGHVAQPHTRGFVGRHTRDLIRPRVNRFS